VTRLTSFAIRCVGIAVLIAAPLAHGAAAQQRDTPPPQPPPRRVPVGTAVISGTITTADTGRPLRGVRVTVVGSTGPTGTRLGGPGGTPAGPLPTVTTGIQAGVGGRGTVQGGINITGGPGMTATRSTITDAQGVFTIEHLPAGRYSINATRTSFLPVSYGQKRPGGAGTTLAIVDGQKASVTLQMIRGGVISGTVFGEDGEPQSNTQVQAWRYAMNNGLKRLQQVGGASTDDRGAYRLFGLQPGEYVVSSRPNSNDMTAIERTLAESALITQAVASGQVQQGSAPGMPATVAIPVQQPQMGPVNGPAGFVPVYHPSVFAPRSATIIRVAGGDEHQFVDIQLQLSRASIISGRVTNPPAAGLGVQLSLVSDDPLSDTSNGSRTDQNGSFTFMNVSPGKYTITATVVSSPQPTVVDGVMTQRVGPPVPLEDSQKWWGRESVSVDGQSTVNASITLQPGRSISGQVIFEMARPPDLVRSKLMVSLSPAPGSPSQFMQLSQALVGPDGRFSLNGVAPGRYVIRVPAGSAKSVMVNGEDTLDFPLEVAGDTDVTNVVATVTDQISEVTGTLSDALGAPSPDFTVLAIASEERFWTPNSRRIVISRTGPTGQYMFRNLPAGSYVLAVVTDLEQGMQYDPEFLRSLVSASTTRVTVTDGGKHTQDLRIR
jgi:hypothetical protein